MSLTRNLPFFICANQQRLYLPLGQEAESSQSSRDLPGIEFLGFFSFRVFARTSRSRGPNAIQHKDKEMCEYGVCSQRRVTPPRHNFFIGYDAKARLVREPNQVGFPVLVAAGGIESPVAARRASSTLRPCCSRRRDHFALAAAAAASRTTSGVTIICIFVWQLFLP